MKRIFYFLIVILFTPQIYGQNYSSYFTGNSTDIVTSPQGGVCMMGGRSEDDHAMRWFLQRANGGDILVLRASGSDGYNNYMYSQLGIQVNSVETIVFNDASAATESYIHDKISKAEAIWFAGGDQWNYISFWRNTDIDRLINEGLEQRNIVIGGTSAGMAILGSYYFTAENGTVTSTEAMSNPYDPKVQISSQPFLNIDHLANVITDTHYDARNRYGRHVSFMARMRQDDGTEPKGIACDEYTAVCIDENGIASVFGDPSKDDFAYFIQTNCELQNTTPENCTVGNPLEWNYNGEALKVYKIKGNTQGSNTIDLKDWKTVNGGSWEHWFISNGNFNSNTGTASMCQLTSELPIIEMHDSRLYINSSEGLILKGRNNNCYLLYIDDDGSLKTEVKPCPQG